MLDIMYKIKIGTMTIELPILVPLSRLLRIVPKAILPMVLHSNDTSIKETKASAASTQSRDDSNTIFPGKDYTDADLLELPWLHGIISETLRLYGLIASALARVAPPEGTVLDGISIPGGTLIGTQSYTIHRDPDLFPKPLELVQVEAQIPLISLTRAT
jgi:hypothetical protein